MKHNDLREFKKIFRTTNYTQSNKQSIKAFETKLNIHLSTIFDQELGLQSISETRRGKGRPDILIYLGGLKILIEGSYSKQDAEKDVKTKIDRGFADVGIALHYKESISDTVDSEVIEQLKKSKFAIRIFTPKVLRNTLAPYIEEKEIMSIAETKWIDLTILELASLIKNNIYDVLIKEEFVNNAIQEIESATSDFVHRLKSIDKNQTIAKNLYDIFYQLYGLHVGDYKQIAELIYAKSFLTLLLSIAFHQTVQPSLNLENIINLTQKYGNKAGLTIAFKEILAIDYKQIFDVVEKVTEKLPTNVFDVVIRLGSKLGSEQTLLKRDFSGLIYHRIVGDWAIRKGFSTFYTRIPASYLLSYLSVFSEFKPFSSAEKIKVCDFACGSGTLLTSTYSSLEDLHILENFEDGKIDLNRFHKKLLEDNLWALDALRYAIQIASLNLVFHNPTIPLKNMNFFSTPLGIDRKNKISLGSLNFLKTGKIIDFFNVNDKATKFSSFEKNDYKKDFPLFDLIIMNPPFARSTGRGGKKGGGLFGFLVDEKIRQQVLSEYRKLRESVTKSLSKISKKHLEKFKDIKGVKLDVIGNAGEGLLFIFLASQYLNEEGRLSMVLPKTFLSGASWFLARTLLFEKFHIEYVIVSYDKDGGYNFSESTDLSEVMIVARKKKTSNELTKFVMLLKQPQTSFESKALAKVIVKEDYIAHAGDAESFQYLVSKKELNEKMDNWGRFVAFPHIRLLRFLNALNDGTLFERKIPLTNLHKIATLGIDRKDFNTYFEISDKKSASSYPVLFGGDEENRLKMIGKCNVFANARNQKADEVFREKSSYLLVPNRVRLTTARVFSIMMPTKTLSNVFYAVKLNYGSITKYKALCTWLNSTFGILLIIANRQETWGPWVSFGQTIYKLQNILDITNIPKETEKKLAKIFDKYCKKEMVRLPQQYDPHNLDPIRVSFDKDVLKALRIPINNETLLELYQMVYDSFNQWFGVEEIDRLVEKPLTEFS